MLFLHFISGNYLSNILLHHFIGFIWIITPLMKINVSIQETKIIVWRSSRALIPFAYRCVTRYAVLTRVKYATTPGNCWSRYPSRSSYGWVGFWPEPIKFLLDMLNHAHWLRIESTFPFSTISFPTLHQSWWEKVGNLSGGGRIWKAHCCKILVFRGKLCLFVHKIFPPLPKKAAVNQCWETWF